MSYMRVKAYRSVRPHELALSPAGGDPGRCPCCRPRLAVASATMARRSALRASDADREAIAEQLRNAAAEGRLLADELEHRLGTAFSARTYGELDAVVADLPRDRVVRRARRRSPIRLRPATALALVVLFPVALALAAAVVVTLFALITAWAVVVTLAGLVLGPRARMLGSPWAIVHYHARRCRRLDDRSAVGGFIPWL
jgi:DUF1707 SHOCT-like domain